MVSNPSINRCEFRWVTRERATEHWPEALKPVRPLRPARSPHLPRSRNIECSQTLYAGELLRGPDFDDDRSLVRGTPGSEFGRIDRGSVSTASLKREEPRRGDLASQKNRPDPQVMSPPDAEVTPYVFAVCLDSNTGIECAEKGGLLEKGVPRRRRTASGSRGVP